MNSRARGRTRDDRMPDFTSQLNVRSGILARGYAGYIPTLVVGLIMIPLIATFYSGLRTTTLSDLTALLNIICARSMAEVVISTVVLTFFLALWLFAGKRPVYLVGFSTFKPPGELIVDHQEYMEIFSKVGFFSEESIKFTEKLLSRSAVGPTAFPEAIYKSPPPLDMAHARAEAEQVMFTCVENVLSENNLSPRDIDVLIVNCSLFCPTPSLSAMVVNKFNMRSDVLSFNLGGMGCSAGVISIDLAKRLLQSQANARVLVISTENITQNWYRGNDRSKLVTNTLFRMGGAAILLSNRRADAKTSLFKLVETVRTHKGGDDECFKCVYQEEDQEGNMGVSLSKSVMSVAGDALQTNITTLGPLVLPISEQLKFFVNLSARTVLKGKLGKYLPRLLARFLTAICAWVFQLPDCTDKSFFACGHRVARKLASLPMEGSEDKSDQYSVGKSFVPDFTKAFQHFCVHAGGRAVIDAIEKNLNLPSEKLDASRSVLYNYGNTSSSSIWYEMEYHVEHSDIQTGDRCWQIAFGSGFKCNSAVWQALRDIPRTK